MIIENEQAEVESIRRMVESSEDRAYHRGHTDATFAKRSDSLQSMQLAADNNGALLTEAREIARELARHGAEISADDVVFEMCKRGYGVKALGNAAGSLFAGRDWQWTGRRVKSKRIHAHKNELKSWVYIGK